MKKCYIALLSSCFLLSAPLLNTVAGVIQIDRHGSGYRVQDQTDVDGRVNVIIYTDTTKVTPILDKAISGLAKDADRVIIHTNEDGSVNRVEYQNHGTSKNEKQSVALKASEDMAGKDVTAIATLKSDIAGKK